MTAVTVGLTPDAARILTDEVKADAAALWSKLLGLYEGGAHKALGYSSWGAYYEAEFGESGRRGYQLLDAARVLDALPEPSVNNCSTGPTESVARELVPVLKQNPEQVEEVWAEVVQEHGPQPTATQVREHVQERVEPAIRTSSAPRRGSVVDEFRSAVLDLDRSVGRLDRLVRDDRFTRNREALSDSYLHDLLRLRASLDTHITQLKWTR